MEAFVSGLILEKKSIELYLGMNPSELDLTNFRGLYANVVGSLRGLKVSFGATQIKVPLIKAVYRQFPEEDTTIMTLLFFNPLKVPGGAQLLLFPILIWHG